MTMVMWSIGMDDEPGGYRVQHLSTQIAAEPTYVSKVFERLAGEHHESGDESSAVRGYN